MESERTPILEEDNEKPDDDSIENVDYQISELTTVFELELVELPHISKYIERLKTIIRRQHKKINKLQSKLKRQRIQKPNELIDASTQTEKDKEHAKPQEDNPSISPNAWGQDEDIAEEVKKISEQTLTASGFVYEPTSGMYYDYKTGYYYNAELRMYYDGNSGRYLVYDENTKQYSFHGENSEVEPKQIKRRKRRRSERLSEEKEEGEHSSSSSEINEPSLHSDVAAAWPPCLRLMVTATSAPGVSVGRLFLVTCEGGVIGREGKPAVLIPELSVSKVHVRFSFSGDSYKIVDVGSRNGTWLNGKRISAALQESEPVDIHHEDEIRIGSTTFSVHVHSGQDTCSGCEPGLQTTSAPAKMLLSVSHREALRNLKKQFGVGKAPNVSTASSDSAYKDRAEERRFAVGSSHPAEKTETASLTQSISTENKGFKMLEKMGWTSGQTLGKSENGLSEPVPLVSNVGATGLGAQASFTKILTHAEKRKQNVLLKTQNRYNQPPVIPKDSSDEET